MMILAGKSKGSLHQKYTRLNFFIKGDEVTTPTIIGHLFPPHDIMNTLIELIMNYLKLPTPHMPAYHPIQHLFELCPLLILHTDPQNQFFLSLGTKKLVICCLQFGRDKFPFSSFFRCTLLLICCSQLN